MIAGGIVLILFTLWVALWHPLANENMRLEEQLPRLRAQAAKMARAGDEIARLRAQASVSPTDMQQAATILERSAATYGLMSGIIGKSADTGYRIPVQFNSASFAAWVAWVDELHRKHRFWLVSCRIVALDAPGMVRIEAEFGGQAPGAR